MTTWLAPFAAASSIASSSIGHHHVEALDGELLLAEKRAAEVPLEPLHVGKPLEQGDALVRRQRLPIGTRLDRVAEPEPLLVPRDVLDLVGDRPAVGLPQLRQSLGEGLGGHVEAKEARRDPCLELGRQLRLEPVGVERRVSGRLGAERVDVRGEMAVRSVRLDERHGGGDPAEKHVVGRSLGGRRRGNRRRRLGTVAAVARELAQPLGVRQMPEDELGVGFEERSPLRVDRLGRGEVVGQQLLDEAAVEIVYLVGFHSWLLRIAAVHTDPVCFTK